MTRFNITLNDSAKFVMFCLKKMKGGEIFVPKIPSYKILDVLKALEKNPKYSLIGIRAERSYMRSLSQKVTLQRGGVQ